MCWVNPTPPILQRDNPHLLLGQSCHLTVLCNKQSTVPLSPDDILKQPIAYYLSVLYIGDNQHQRRPGWRVIQNILFRSVARLPRSSLHFSYWSLLPLLQIQNTHTAQIQIQIHIMHPITAQNHTWLNFAIRRLMTKPQDYKL